MMIQFLRSKWNLIFVAAMLVTNVSWAEPTTNGATSGAADGVPVLPEPRSQDAAESAAGVDGVADPNDLGHGEGTESGVAVQGTEAHGETHGEAHADGHEAAGGHHEEGGRPVFEPEHGTWFNWPARLLFAREEAAYADKQAAAIQAGVAKANAGETLTAQDRENNYLVAAFEAQQAKKAGQPLSDAQKEALKVHYPAQYDWLVFTPLLWIALAVFLVGAARKGRVRPEGKPSSASNAVEAAVEGFYNYLIGVMGPVLARKYLPLIASFFFTILAGNYLGLVPGMLSPSAMPAIPIAMAIVAFFATHFIAIKEVGFKPWIMHFVGEPVWLAPLNFPLHFVGELIKPISLALRLLCNIFGEEAVVATLIGLAILVLPTWLPIPFQLPMLFLGILFGFLQALVFSTLLAIYISVLSTHHDEHGGHDHTEHAHDTHGQEMVVGRPSASPTA